MKIGQNRAVLEILGRFRDFWKFGTGIIRFGQNSNIAGISGRFCNYKNYVAEFLRRILPTYVRMGLLSCVSTLGIELESYDWISMMMDHASRIMSVTLFQRIKIQVEALQA